MAEAPEAETEALPSTPVVPTKPFSWTLKGQPGERGRVSVWSAPFDTEFRPNKVPNAPDIAVAALASIGEHVVSNAATYCPAYRVVRTINARTLNSKAEMDAALADNNDYMVILDRRSGKITHLDPAFSPREALISWFVRELGHEGSVLCVDREKKETYVEEKRSELTVALGADGTEVAVDEPHTEELYLVEKHPNAVMVYGE